MKTNTLAKEYQDGENIVRQGDRGDQVYVVQDGFVEVLGEYEGMNYQLTILGAGDFFGEMALFERGIRGATVRALGPARVLTIEKRDFLGRIKEDPAQAIRLVETLSARIRQSNQQVVQLRSLLFESGIPADIGSARVNYPTGLL